MAIYVAPVVPGESTVIYHHTFGSDGFRTPAGQANLIVEDVADKLNDAMRNPPKGEKAAGVQ